MTPDREFKRTFDKLFAPINVRKRREAELMKRVADRPALQKAAGIVDTLQDIRKRLAHLEKIAAAERAALAATRH